MSTKIHQKREKDLIKVISNTVNFDGMKMECQEIEKDEIILC